MLRSGSTHQASPSDAAPETVAPPAGGVARRRRLASLAVVAVLTGAVLLLDARPFVTVSTLAGRHDNATFNFPIRLEVARQWREGRLPLWNPYQFAGFPLLGDITSAALYPGNVPFLLEPDGTRYVALDHVATLHFVIAALCMYVFARALALSWMAASLASLVYAGNGFLLFLASRWIQAQSSAAWLPLILASIVQAGGAGNLGLWVGVGAIAVALQILSGYPQYVFYTGLLAGVLALVTAYGRSTRRWRPLAAVVAVYALGAALAAVQLLPAVEVASLSRRASGVSLDEFLQLPASPAVIAGMMMPRAAATTTFPYVVVGGIFVGTLVVALAVEGARSRAPLRVFLTITLLVTFVLAIGPFSPLGTLAHGIPGLNAFRYPFKHLLEVVFCVAALAGFGVQSLLDGRRGARTCVAVGALFTAGWSAPVLLRPASFHWSIAVSVAGAATFLVLVLFDRRRAAAVAALATVWLTLAGNRGALFALASVEIPALPPIVDTLGQRNRTVLGPRYAAALRSATRPDDVYGLLGIDYPTEFRVPSVHGSSPFVWGPLRDALSLSEDGMFTRPRVVAVPSDQTLDLLGVRYVGSTQQPFGGTVIQEQPRAIVAERARALPVLRFVDRALCLDPGATSEELHRRRYDFGAVALLDCESRPPLPAIARARQLSRISLVEGTAGRLRMRTRVPGASPGVLVVSQADMPGWQARVDGAAVPIYRAYGLVQAIVVPPGVHDVDLDYLPRSFVTGGAVSLVALVAGLGACAFAHRRARRGTTT